ncbi:serine/threonine-protein kinase [Planomonospora sp. ID82291]|uniref:serine/threonine protein kinase n=1 Tax=Planomonospora sp. ID82291 TaxID=2738136 RepID=UPI0018C44AA1|nr:serine/threonine-protein kinase [Planomonospora sp. ID82291]MBG0816253.1 protein kinase [Planomonospora sp. ID82291]
MRPGDPERVREYRLTARLGEGGQGTVYLGESETGARVAVKLLRADLAQDEEALERFVREVSTAQRVSPFCTAAVLDTGVDRHRPYIVSEYIDGPTLDAVVAAEGPRSGSALHRLAIGTVTALVAIHQAGIVHRDFKPSNVLLAPDGPRVIDFGIAKALDRTSTLTAMAIGTPSYMTPEQLAGEAAGSAADMFAWGCTMVFAATGAPPFGTDSLPAIFNRIMNAEPDLSAIADAALRELVGDCLAKDARRRPTASEALMRLLGHSGAGTTGGAPPVPPQGILAEGSAVAAQQTGPGPDGVSHPTGPGGFAHPAGPGGHPPHQTGPGGFPQQAGPGGYPPHQTGPGGFPQQAGPGGHPPHQTGPGGFAHPAGPGGYPPHQTGPGGFGQTVYGVPPQGAAPYPGSEGHPGGVFAQPPVPGPQAPYADSGGYGRQSPYGVPPQGAAPYGGPGGRSGHQEPGGPGGQGAGAQGAGRVRRAWIAVGAGLAVALAGGGVTLALQGIGGSGATPSSSPAAGASATPTPIAARVPQAAREIRLPGSSTTIHESDEDPIRLTSYSLTTAGKFHLYARKHGANDFAAADQYIDYTVNPQGTGALATDLHYDKDNHALVSIIDRVGGAVDKVRITKAPVYPSLPQWSPDGRKGLVTLYQADADVTKPSHPYGYAIIDIAAKKAKIVKVKEKDAGTWSYFWRGDGRAVGTWAIDGSTRRIRFYDLEGTVLQTLLDVGTPLTVEGEDVNPSGSLIMTYCKGTEKEICVWSTAADGEPQARIPFATKRVVGWYDDRHIAVWRAAGSGFEAVVIDLEGRVERVLAETADAKEYEKQFMRYTRVR